MMQVGVLYQGLPPARPSDIGRWVEDLGYDSIWVGDHVLFYVDGLTTAMALGAGTQRITVGNAILLVPLRNPALLARSLATMALEMPGRYVLGAGAGGDVPSEFEVTGAKLKGRGARMERTVASLRAALDEGTLDGHDFGDRPDAGAPPIWFGGRTDRAALRAATIGDGFIPYLVTPSQFSPLVAQVEEARAAGPRAHLPFTAGVDIMMSIEDTYEKALEHALAYRAYGLDEDQIKRHTIIGTPDDAVEGLARFAEHGARHVIAHVAAPPTAKRDQIERIGALLDDVRALATGQWAR
jgi:alkanesulfonate monooxygenase SsuD/methylene tetrahydromethanopterin reductase-like flavin-dependent oxidoreductase (luciferase family)